MYRDSRHDLFDLFSEFDDAFRSFFADPWGSGRRMLTPGAPGDRPAVRAAAFRPAMEAITRDGNLVLRAELPGVDPSDVEVTLTGNTLVIRGEKKQDLSREDGAFVLREIARGTFERSFTLPEEAVDGDITANHVNGVLEVTIPMKNLPASKRIPVGTGGRKTISSRNAA